MEIVFLGTTAMVPTKSRNHTSILLKYENRNILFDCGEGTQRQFRFASLKPSKLDYIFITHWHGDHVLGLPGLLQTLSANGYKKTLKIFGPVGTKRFVKSMLNAFIFYFDFNIEVYDLKNLDVFEDDRFYIKAYKLDHTTDTLGYRFVEKDKWKIDLNKAKEYGVEKENLGKIQKGLSVRIKNRLIKPEMICKKIKGKIISFIFDTKECKNAYELAKDSDIAIIEATFDNELLEKAIERKHLTAEQAGLIAKKSNSKKLIITHFSQRYKNIRKLLNQTKRVFKNTIAAKDFMRIRL